LGLQALQANTTASNNTAVGYQAGYSNTTGTQCTYIGRIAGYSATGSYNTFIGDYAGNAVTSGTSNSFLGQYSGALITTGSKNTIIGGYSGNNGGLDIRTASNYIVLSDGDGNPRGVWDSSGNFLVGTTSTFASFTGVVSSQNSSGKWCMVAKDAAGNGAAIAFLWSTGSQVGSIATTSVATIYNTTSDYRLKLNAQPLTNSGEFIDSLQPKTWTWEQDGSKGSGFFAHEFQIVSPTSVFGKKDAVDEEGKPVYQSMDSSTPEVMANLIAEIQSLRKRLSALEAGAKA